MKVYLFLHVYENNMLNLLCSDGFSHTYSYNKYEIAHFVFKGSQVEVSEL